MPGKRDRILSGWRARRLLRTGGLIVRDGAAFRVHQWADERSRRCGRLPGHVVARLKAAGLLVAFRGDPDRLVQSADVPVEVPRPVADPFSASGTRPVRVLEHIAASSPLGVRLRAAAGRFQADYHLAASPGGLRTDAPKQRAAACNRLASIENALGSETTGLVEVLVLDRFTVSALQHETGAGPDRAGDALARLTEAYGLRRPDQEAGRAFASS